MKKYLAPISLVLWLFTTLGVGWMFVRGNRAASIPGDQRTVVALSVVEREYILLEMREFLKAVHEVHAALVSGDTKQAIISTRKMGMGNHDVVVENAQPGLMLKIPLAMKKLGHATHANMDHIAGLFERKASEKEIQTALSSLTEKCTACHSSFRLNR